MTDRAVECGCPGKSGVFCLSSNSSPSCVVCRLSSCRFDDKEAQSIHNQIHNLSFPLSPLHTPFHTPEQDPATELLRSVDIILLTSYARNGYSSVWKQCLLPSSLVARTPVLICQSPHQSYTRAREVIWARGHLHQCRHQPSRMPSYRLRRLLRAAQARTECPREPLTCPMSFRMQ